MFDLTQSLQDRTRENKDLRASLLELEAQLSSWQNRHEELDARARGLQAEVQKPSVPIQAHETLQLERHALESQLHQAQERIHDLELEIATLQSQIRSLEAPESMVQSLRNEIVMLREQLSRATAENERNGTTVPLGPRAHVQRAGGVGTTGVAMAGSRPVSCLLYTSPSPRDQRGSRMPSSA